MAVNPSRSREIQQQREEAWLGDAVLALLVREWILSREGRMDARLFAELTSNHFLSRFGAPTAVEAEIGRVYQGGGMEAVRVWADRRLMPHFERFRHLRAGRR